jgi:hypothetical protein
MAETREGEMSKPLKALGMAGALALSACVSTKPMALSSTTQKIDVSQESVALMTVRLGNTYKLGRQPHFKYVQVRRDDGSGEDLNYEIAEILAQSEDEANQFEEAALSLPLRPGKYQLRFIWVNSPSLLAPGNGQVPIYSRFEVKPGQIVYLGRAETTRRERKSDDELRAGSVIPLIDQAVSGFSGGTFDVAIRDSYDEDLVKLRKLYPALEGAEIAKAVLPAWRKPTDEEMK